MMYVGWHDLGIWQSKSASCALRCRGFLCCSRRAAGCLADNTTSPWLSWQLLALVGRVVQVGVCMEEHHTSAHPGDKTGQARASRPGGRNRRRTPKEKPPPGGCRPRSQPEPHLLSPPAWIYPALTRQLTRLYGAPLRADPAPGAAAAARRSARSRVRHQWLGVVRQLCAYE